MRDFMPVLKDPGLRRAFDDLIRGRSDESYDE